MHERLHGQYIQYISMDDLLNDIEAGRELTKALQKLSKYKSALRSSDCVVLGCSHFCMHARRLSRELATLGFAGDVVNSVDVFVKSL